MRNTRRAATAHSPIKPGNLSGLPIQFRDYPTIADYVVNGNGVNYAPNYVSNSVGSAINDITGDVLNIGATPTAISNYVPYPSTTAYLGKQFSYQTNMADALSSTGAYLPNGTQTQVPPVINTPGAIAPLNMSSLPVSNAVTNSPVISVGDSLGGMGYMDKFKNWGSKMADNLQTGWDKLDLTQQAGLVGKALMGGYGLYNSHKQLGMAQDALNFQKDTFNKNWDASRKEYNSSLADRQERRNHTAQLNGAKVASVNEYMDKYGI